MTKSTSNILALMPVAPEYGEDSALRPLRPWRQPSRDEQRVLAQAQHDQSAMDAMLGKLFHGQRIVEDLDVHSAVVFDRGASRLIALKRKPRDPEVQAYVDVFTSQNIPRLAHQLVQLQDVGAHYIGEIATRPFDLSPEPSPQPVLPVRRGLLARVFGE